LSQQLNTDGYRTSRRAEFTLTLLASMKEQAK